MCDEKPMWINFGLVSAAIAGALASALVGIATNTNWWTVWLSPILLGAAAGSAAVGASLIFAVQAAMNAYFLCMKGAGPEHCTNERDTADRYLVAMGAALGTAATIAFYNLFITLVPIAGSIPMWAFYAAVAAQLALLPLLGAALGSLVSCLKNQTSSKKTSLSGAKLEFDVATCPLNKTSCAEADMRIAGRSATPIFSVSPSFAVLVKAKTQVAIASLTAEVIDGFGNKSAISSNAIRAPQAHRVVDPSYFAILCTWSDLSAQGIRLEPGNRQWQVLVEATFADSSTEKLKVEALVAT